MKERITQFGLPALALIASIGIGFAGITSAQSANTPQNAQERPFQREYPAVAGTITAISGTTIMVSSAERDTAATATTYTVDISGAKVLKASSGSAPSESATASLAVGDTVMIRGTVSGTSVVATEVMDGMGGGPGMHGRGPGMGRGGTVGTVTAVNGSTITLSGKDGTTYTVDASSAKISTMATITAADIKVGDTLGVQGTVSGTAVTAHDIMDGLPPAPDQE
jgi:hypothetical protein